MKKKLNKFLITMLSIVTFIPFLSGCSDEEWLQAKHDVEDWWSNVTDGATDFADKVVKFSEPIIDKVKEGAIYAYDNVSHFTMEAYEAMCKKGEELAGNVNDYFTGFSLDDLKNYEIQYSEASEKPIKDLNGVAKNPYNINHSEQFDYYVENFIPYYVSTIIGSYGYEVYYGVAFQKGNVYPGLIFTNNNETIEYQKEETYTCGFLQLVTNKDDLNNIVTEELVEKGLIAVPNEEYVKGNVKQDYVITEFTSINPQACVVSNNYFELEQINNYVLKATFKKNCDATYSAYHHEIYDFDNNRVLKEAGKQTVQEYVKTLDDKEFECCSDAVNAIADMQEQMVGSEEEITNIITVSSDVVDFASTTKYQQYIDSLQEGEVEDKDVSTVSINDATEKICKLLEDNEESVDISNKVLSAISGAMAITGMAASIVICIAGSSVAIKAIVITTGVSSIVYNIGNIIGNITAIYDPNGEGTNPIYNAFAAVTNNASYAKLAYHAWGIGNSIIAGLCVPASKSLTISRIKGYGKFRTFINLIRSVMVTIAKGGIAAFGAALIGNYTKKIVTYVTDSRLIGNVVGFASTIIVGILIYKGLDKIDQSLNISGLYPKENVMSGYKKSYGEENEFKTTHDNASFKNMSRSEKEYAARYVRDMVCDELGIDNKPSLEFTYDPNSTTAGGYNPTHNSIEINFACGDNTTWQGFVDSIAHECRHAYQFEYATMNPNSDMAYSLQNYITPDAGYDAYRYQLCESDAWSWAASFATKFLTMFGIAF